jgi:NitT/TauT family transport system substrate-binding protein
MKRRDFLKQSGLALASAPLLAAGPGLIGNVLAGGNKVIADYPEAVQELVSGLTRTAAYIDANPAAAAQASQRLIGQKPAIVETVLTTPKGRLTFQDLRPREADFAATQDYMVRFGIAKDRADLGAYLNDRFAQGAA